MARRWIVVVRDTGWGDRQPQFEPQQSPPPSVHYSFPQMGMNDEVDRDGRTDFEFSRFVMAVMLLPAARWYAGEFSAAPPGPPGRRRLPPSPPAVAAMATADEGDFTNVPPHDCGRIESAHGRVLLPLRHGPERGVNDPAEKPRRYRRGLRENASTIRKPNVTRPPTLRTSRARPRRWSMPCAGRSAWVGDGGSPARCC